MHSNIIQVGIPILHEWIGLMRHVIAYLYVILQNKLNNYLNLNEHDYVCIYKQSGKCVA
jgi:hypothetical protein